jgi:hypothetical protein
MGTVDPLRDGMGGSSASTREHAGASQGDTMAPTAPMPATSTAPPPAAPMAPMPSPSEGEWVVDLERRRDQLTARLAELQWDLGGLVYEMAIRDRVRVDVLIKKAAALQDVDAELGEVERILRMEKTGVAGTCKSCDAPHSGGAVFCWQCGNRLLEQVPHDTIGRL